MSDRDRALVRFDALSQRLLTIRRKGLTTSLTEDELTEVDQCEAERRKLRETFPDTRFGLDRPRSGRSDKTHGHKNNKAKSRLSKTRKAPKRSSREQKMISLRSEIETLTLQSQSSTFSYLQQTRLSAVQRELRKLEDNAPSRKARGTKSKMTISPRGTSKPSGRSGRVGLISVHRGGLRQTRGRR